MEIFTDSDGSKYYYRSNGRNASFKSIQYTNDVKERFVTPSEETQNDLEYWLDMYNLDFNDWLEITNFSNEQKTMLSLMYK